jgi:5-(carboxyamino)imidazole ribonucleotide mutase
MGSENDYSKVEPAIGALEDLGVECKVTVASAHRSPQRAAKIAAEARDNGVGVIIAAAGGANHLGGAMAANSTLPVIALPLEWGGMGGLDALLSSVQMPGGVPIAAVGVNGAKNAGLIAAAIISITDADLAQRMADTRVKQAQGVVASDKRIQDKLAARD